MTPELFKQVFDQDFRFADYVDKVAARRHDDAGLKQLYRSLRSWLEGWSQWYAEIGSHQTTPNKVVLDAIAQTWFPTARGAGFPEEVLVMPEIQFDDEDRDLGGMHYHVDQHGNRVTPVGLAMGADPTATPTGRYAARRRAVRAIFDLTSSRAAAAAPTSFYFYAETARGTTARRAESAELARALAIEAQAQDGGQVYTAEFSVNDPSWPDPSREFSRDGAADPSVAVAGVGGHHGAMTDTMAGADPSGGLSPSDAELVNQRADNIFWAQTGYKVGQKLNPQDPSDRAMIPVWLVAHGTARAELAGLYAQMYADASDPATRRPAPMSLAPEAADHRIAVNGTPNEVPAMNSNDPWLPFLRTRHNSVGRELKDLAGWGARRDRGRPDLVKELAPGTAPGTGAITATIEVVPDPNGDPVSDGLLRVRACVDGKCYVAEVDVSSIIAQAQGWLAEWHKEQHPTSHPLVGRWGGGRGRGEWGHRYWGPRVPRWGYRYGGGYSYYVPPVYETFACDPNLCQAPPGAPGGPQQPAIDQDQDFGPSPQDSPAPVVSASAIEYGIRDAGEKLVVALVGQHIAVGNFFDDIGHALQSTLKFMKPVIETGAVAGLTALGVPPQISSMATQLVGPLIDSAANAGKPSPKVQQAQQAAQTNPQAAQALQAAKQVTSQSIASAHAATTLQAAQQGSPAAQQQVQQTMQAAQQGDPAAQQLAAAMNAIRQQGQQMQQMQQQLTNMQPLPPPDPAFDPSLICICPPPASASGWVGAGAPMLGPILGTGAPTFYEIVGAALVELRVEAQRAVMGALSRNSRKPVLGYVKTAEISTVVPFGSGDEADDWFGKLDPSTYLYAAYFDATDPTWPNPLNEAAGAVVRATPAPGAPIQRGIGTVSGQPIPLVGHWALPMLFGAGAGAGGMAAWNHRDAIKSWFTRPAGA